MEYALGRLGSPIALDIATDAMNRVWRSNSFGLFLRLGWFFLGGLLLTATGRAAARAATAGSKKHGKWKLTTIVISDLSEGDHRCFSLWSEFTYASEFG